VGSHAQVGKKFCKLRATCWLTLATRRASYFRAPYWWPEARRMWAVGTPGFRLAARDLMQVMGMARARYSIILAGNWGGLCEAKRLTVRSGIGCNWGRDVTSGLAARALQTDNARLTPCESKPPSFIMTGCSGALYKAAHQFITTTMGYYSML
jgi:hypothetical protein